MSNKQRLEELEATIKNALVEIEELKKADDRPGFDWDFKDTSSYYSYSDGDFRINTVCHRDYEIKNVSWFKTKEYCIKSARSNAWNSLLFRLAEHFNPKGWEWVVGHMYHSIAFCARSLRLMSFDRESNDWIAAKFHPDVINDVIKELNNNKSEWWHIVTDAELVG